MLTELRLKKAQNVGSVFPPQTASKEPGVPCRLPNTVVCWQNGCFAPPLSSPITRGRWLHCRIAGPLLKTDIRPWISLWVLSANADRDSRQMLTRHLCWQVSVNWYLEIPRFRPPLYRVLTNPSSSSSPIVVLTVGRLSPQRCAM